MISGRPSSRRLAARLSAVAAAATGLALAATGVPTATAADQDRPI